MWLHRRQLIHGLMRRTQLFFATQNFTIQPCWSILVYVLFFDILKMLTTKRPNHWWLTDDELRWLLCTFIDDRPKTQATPPRTVTICIWQPLVHLALCRSSPLSKDSCCLATDHLIPCLCAPRLTNRYSDSVNIAVLAIVMGYFALLIIIGAIHCIRSGG